MRKILLIACSLFALPAHADPWSQDDTGYGRPSKDNPCDCAPGEDGIDWNGDGLSNSDDAAYADPDAYKPGTAFGHPPATPGDPFGSRGDKPEDGEKVHDHDKAEPLE